MVGYRASLRALGFAVVVALCCTPVRADPAASKSWFEGLPLEARVAVQSELILTGHYQAMAEGAFNEHTYRAIQSYQAGMGFDPTGFLTSSQFQALEAETTRIYQNLGIEQVVDERSTLVLLLPRKLLPNVEQSLRGTTYGSADGSIRLETIRTPFAEESYEGLYNLLAYETGREVSYKVLRSNRFVVTGTRGDKLFYIMVKRTPGESIGFSLEWSSLQHDYGAMLSTFFASHSYPAILAGN